FQRAAVSARSANVGVDGWSTANTVRTRSRESVSGVMELISTAMDAPFYRRCVSDTRVWPRTAPSWLLRRVRPHAERTRAGIVHLLPKWYVPVTPHHSGFA